MAKGYKYGPMEPSMKECGIKERLQAKAFSLMLMVTLTMGNGRTIKRMAMESILILKLEQNIKDIGKTICNMDRVFKFIQMETDTKACSRKENEMAREPII